MNTQLKTIFVFLFLVCTLRGTAQNFSIDYPSYQNRNSDALEISRIVRNDTATILYMDAYSRPDYWLRLASGLSLHGNQTGKNYPIIRSQGFELNKEVYMPASGNITFILQFAPLAPQEETIDFIEGTNKGDFQIKDISLNKQEKKGKIHCHISGKIIDSPQSSRLVLMKAHKNPSSSPWLSIPIRNGEFQYDFYADHEEVYEVFIWNDMLTGSWLPSLFFAENGPVSFTLYPASTRKPGLVSTSNPLTCELQQLESERKAKFNFDSLYAQMNKLYEENRFESEALQTLWKKIEQVKDNNEERNNIYRERDRLEESGEAYTEEGKALLAKIKQLNEEMNQWTIKHIKQNPSLPGLYVLTSKTEMARKGEDVTPFLNAYQETFASLYPEHPYGQQMQMLIKNGQPEIGKPYVDFSAPDLNGNKVQISKYIQGKVALIDLWASWCGPCRVNSKQVIPIYEKYKNKGFTVIGVAREQGSDARMKEAIKKDGYPWLNLIELNDTNQIWTKYRIPNAAGGTFLVNAEGIILAINPTVEEIESILQKELLTP